MFVDWYLRRGRRVEGLLFDKAHNPWAGFAAMAIGMVASIWLFSNQEQYTGPAPKALPALGDITFEVGFVLAGLLYLLFFKLSHEER